MGNQPARGIALNLAADPPEEPSFAMIAWAERTGDVRESVGAGVVAIFVVRASCGAPVVVVRCDQALLVRKERAMSP
jgi:hypothetical protein